MFKKFPKIGSRRGDHYHHICSFYVCKLLLQITGRWKEKILNMAKESQRKIGNLSSIICRWFFFFFVKRIDNNVGHFKVTQRLWSASEQEIDLLKSYIQFGHKVPEFTQG